MAKISNETKLIVKLLKERVSKPMKKAEFLEPDAKVKSDFYESGLINGTKRVLDELDTILAELENP